MTKTVNLPPARVKDLPKNVQWLGRLVEHWVTNRNRKRRLKLDAKRLPIIESAIEDIRDNLRKAKTLGAKDSIAVQNCALYLLLIELDVSVIRLGMVSTFDDWQLRFHARQLGLVIFESLEKLRPLTNTVRSSLVAADASGALASEMDRASGMINPFKARHQKFLANLRNDASAHRTTNALLYIETIENIDSLKVMRIAVDFFAIVGELIEVLTKGMLHIGTTRGIIKDMLRHHKSVK